MNWRKKFLLLYGLVGFAGVLFVEFQNLFILESSLKKVLLYNLPFVLAQLSVFVAIFYFYTVKNLKDIFQSNPHELTQQEKNEHFNILSLFPFKLFKFSIFITFMLALSFHLYEIIFLEEITKSFLYSLVFSLLREMSLAMIITLMVVAGLVKFLRPYILKLKIATIETVHLPFKRKVNYIFFAILFIFLTDIIWLITNDYGSLKALLVKITVTVGILSVMAIFTIKLTLLDSMEYINEIVKQISVNVEDRDTLRSIVPVASSDEVSFLIGGFNKLQTKIGDLYQEIDEELELAFLVQQNLLPKKTHPFGHYIVEGYTIPVKEVGGDFFDIIPIGERKMAILIGDVSGKGLPAALLMSVMLGVVRGKIRTESFSPAALLSDINQVLIPLLPDGMFVTAGLGIVDLDADRFFYGSAGHVPPLIKRNGELSYFEQSSLPLGLDSDEIYLETMFPISELDGVVFYTDGIIERVDKYNEMFGFDKLYQFFSEGWSHDIKTLMNDIQKAAIDDKYADDMTIVQMKLKDTIRL